MDILQRSDMVRDIDKVNGLWLASSCYDGYSAILIHLKSRQEPKKNCRSDYTVALGKGLGNVEKWLIEQDKQYGLCSVHDRFLYQIFKIILHYHPDEVLDLFEIILQAIAVLLERNG